ncbi:MAG: response regulator [Geothrix sp.]|nr:response regulator [Geothrix sp.]
MPRLLLVDDNPSIHRIAESLLAPTDVELVCVDSAAEALDRIGRGERFDVALVDTAMPGMDGWTLLGRLRAMEATARMPIALMAGVLDPVDPSKLAKAPIQGFLKKPIELRELGDRVMALLATPVVTEPSPFITVPATPARDLVRRAETALPEYRPEPAEASAGLIEFEGDFPEAEEDLLVLDAGDLWPEEAPPPAVEASASEIPVEALPSPVQAAPDMHLELEELDLDSLQDLAGESLPAFEPIAGMAAFEPAADLLVLEPSADLLVLEPVAVLLVLEPVAGMIPEPAPGVDPGFLGGVMEEEALVTLSGLEELDAFSADFQMPLPTAPAAVPAPAPEYDDDFLDLPVAASIAGVAAAGLAVLPDPGSAPAGLAFAPAPPPEAAAAPALLSAAGGQAPAAPGQAVPPEQAQALIQALLADPVLVDALVKAVVARMGDQVLREIAWEVMPDLAGRLQR